MGFKLLVECYQANLTLEAKLRSKYQNYDLRTEYHENKEKIENVSTVIAICYHNVAAEYEFLRIYDEALAYLREGIDFAKQCNVQNPLLINKMKLALKDLIAKKQVESVIYIYIYI